MLHPHLSNAPIKEALIDIQGFFSATSSPEEILKSFETGYPKIQYEFPVQEPRNFRQVTIGPVGNPAVLDSKLGFLYKSQDGSKIVQYRLNGFTLSHLRPYAKWEELRKDAQTYWIKFLELRSDFIVNRVAVRFINQIAVPFPLTDDELYLKEIPKPVTGAGVSQTKSFAQQLTWTEPSPSAKVNLIRILQEPAEGSLEASVTIDIDIYRAIEDSDPENNLIWEILDAYQSLKNDIFFNLIGEKTIKRYL